MTKRSFLFAVIWLISRISTICVHRDSWGTKKGLGINFTRDEKFFGPIGIEPWLAKSVI